MCELVRDGDHIVVQRQEYMKFHKISLKNFECRLGKDTVNLSNTLGQSYWSTFKMEPDQCKKNYYNLVKCKAAGGLSDEIMKTAQSGIDNRDITDDGSSQKLSAEDIIGLRESGLSAQSLVGTLIENSKTFAFKTEYSQEKYLKKKEKKYFEYVLIRKPNLRITAEILINKGLNKTMGLRMDTLCQLTTLACVRAGGRYIAYETGCQGLVCAAVLNQLGDIGSIIHVHAGAVPERQAVMTLNFSQERLNQLTSVSIQKLVQKQPVTESSVIKSESANGSEATTECCGKRKLPETSGATVNKRAKWEESEDKAVAELNDRLSDGLIVAGKEHPANITRCLLRYLQPSRPFVVFFNVREPLQELFLEFKIRSDITALRLTETWMRSYQILPDRTHPDISMNGSGGYLLTGIKVTS